jgi:GxxExxY protein
MASDEAKLIAELKSVDAPGLLHEAIILTYMRFAGRHPGLLIHFNVPMLKDGIRRYIL